MIRAGDHVRHGPTGEDWMVLAVDGERLVPAGWPPCVARTSDCTLVEACTDDEHRRMARVCRTTGHADAWVGRGHTCDVCEAARPSEAT